MKKMALRLSGWLDRFMRASLVAGCCGDGGGTSAMAGTGTLSTPLSDSTVD